MSVLESGQALITELDFKAGDRDRAVAAFETFRRGVTHANGNSCSGDRQALESMEPKRRILDFLLEFARLRQVYRSRVVEVLTALMATPAWTQVAQADSGVCAEVRRLLPEWEACPPCPCAPGGAAAMPQWPPPVTSGKAAPANTDFAPDPWTSRPSAAVQDSAAGRFGQFGSIAPAFSNDAPLRAAGTGNSFRPPARAASATFSGSLQPSTFAETPKGRHRLLDDIWAPVPTKPSTKGPTARSTNPFKLATPQRTQNPSMACHANPFVAPRTQAPSNPFNPFKTADALRA